MWSDRSHFFVVVLKFSIANRQIKKSAKNNRGLSSKVCKYFCPYLNFVNHAYFLYRKLALLTYATI